jgi:uncharacterized protein YecT (DUF1311 family)
MSRINWDHLITAEDRAEKMRQDRADQTRAACRLHILNVMDEDAQANLSARAALNQLDKGDQKTAKAAIAWIAEMIAECRAAVDQGRTPDWPSVPAGVADLGQRY